MGKVGIPDTLLTKDGPLPEEEFGLVKTHTTIGARMLEGGASALADYCDALGHDRPYRKAWPKEQIQEEVRRQAGSHFDPEVVRAYFSMG